MVIKNLSSVAISGTLGGACAAFIRNTGEDLQSPENSRLTRAVEFLCITLIGTISALAAYALAQYVTFNVVNNASLIGALLYKFYSYGRPEESLSHRTTAIAFAIICGIAFSQFELSIEYPKSTASSYKISISL